MYLCLLLRVKNAVYIFNVKTNVYYTYSYPVSVTLSVQTEAHEIVAALLWGTKSWTSMANIEMSL